MAFRGRYGTSGCARPVCVLPCSAPRHGFRCGNKTRVAYAFRSPHTVTLPAACCLETFLHVFACHDCAGAAPHHPLPILFLAMRRLPDVSISTLNAAQSDVKAMNFHMAHIDWKMCQDTVRNGKVIPGFYDPAYPEVCADRSNKRKVGFTLHARFSWSP